MFVAAVCLNRRQKPARTGGGASFGVRARAPLLSVPPLLSSGERQTGTMKALVRLLMLMFLSGLAVLPAQAAFSSLYVFGDGVCSTSAAGGQYYYDHTYSNGQIWVQVLAQLQGVTYDPSKNLSDEWHDSNVLLTEVNQFSAADANTSLFVVWCNDADFVDDMTYIYPNLDTTSWNDAITSSLNNHSSIISTLYAKGARRSEEHTS